MMTKLNSRGAVWLDKLAPNAPRMGGLCPSVQVADGELNGETVRFIAVVPDADNHFPRAAQRRSGPAGRLDAGEGSQ
ncbi:malonate decarboxylase, gamma subunit [Pluralibacter gergoviae]|nr:malonate decarboxylase, gamma subunit [Pluralibacter gergoviae]